jgi:hypothetical protein
MTTHTPGPWVAVDGDIFTEHRHKPIVASTFEDGEPMGTGITRDAAFANAALIAAAPDLLAALEELLWAAARTSLETDGDYSDAFAAARAAIAKAQGTTP